MDINEAIDKYYYPLSITQYRNLLKEFSTTVMSLSQKIVERNESVLIDAAFGPRNIKIAIFLMIRDKDGNNFVNVIPPKRGRWPPYGIQTYITLNLGQDNVIFDPEIELGNTAYLYDFDPRRHIRSTSYASLLHIAQRNTGIFNLFIVLSPTRIMDDMMTNQINNTESLRRAGNPNAIIPSMRVLANIRLEQAAQPINNAPEDMPRNDITDRTRETQLEFYQEDTINETLRDMGENLIVRNENIVNVLEPQQELEVILSTTPNIARTSDVTNSLIDFMVAQLVSKGDPQDFADAIFQGQPASSNILGSIYNRAIPYIGALLPRRLIPDVPNRTNFYSILSIITGVSVITTAILYWNESLIKRKIEADTGFMQEVLDDNLKISSDQDVVDQYIKYIATSNKLTTNDKDLLNPLLQNTVVYYVQDNASYVSFPETMQSLDDNNVKLDPYFPEKYASNLPTPNPSSTSSPTSRYSPTPTISLSPSASIQPSATPRFTPGREYNMGDNYEPTIIEKALDVVTGETSIIPHMSWVGSVLPILGSLISNGLGVLTSFVTSGISIVSYIIIAGLAIGAYFFTTRK